MRRMVIGLLVSLALPAAALAEMQCEGRLIGIGASIAEVLDACGEPTHRVRTERALSTGLLDSPGSELVPIPVEEWTYEEPGQFTRRLVFESGRLEKIETGGYPDLPPE